MNSRAARRAFARLWMRRAGVATSSPLGALTPRPAQVRAVARIDAAFAEPSGAWLPGPPGPGETIVPPAAAARRVTGRSALRAARDPEAQNRSPDLAALVLAPSALRGQWERAARRARVAISFIALEAMSRGAMAQ